ncbi:hypothetical protein P0R31_36235 [Bradyrhizobium yuanmingense]|uniref:hypothetical protein n=1 Tax=Bradyrhizobium yuanmingense TaxID=108015 RepID=UPI0023B92792|nr:hypothetical protein [Bradyrhizobium yuanmingense]MDF0522691.1 hypothetical protein [Bradyrhizobium yuanmingense]
MRLSHRWLRPQHADGNIPTAMFWPFTQPTAGLGALYILHMAEHALLVETLLSEIVG